MGPHDAGAARCVRRLTPAVLDFQAYLTEHASEPLAEVPTAHWPAIASLAQERYVGR